MGDKRLGEIYSDTVQNRFTAYLMAAVMNKRIRYMEKKMRLQDRELELPDMLDKNYADFDAQYHTYLSEKSELAAKEWDKIQELLLLMESEWLIKLVGKLKDRERKLLFARVFGELTFEELGKRFGCTKKQAEMSYYILRKLRKELEVRRDEL